MKLELVHTGEGHVVGTNEAEVAVLLRLGIVTFLVLKIREKSNMMIRILKMSSLGKKVKRSAKQPLSDVIALADFQSIMKLQETYLANAQVISRMVLFHIKINCQFVLIYA